MILYTYSIYCIIYHKQEVQNLGNIDGQDIIKMDDALDV